MGASTTQRLASFLGFLAVLGAGACFDSDEQFTPRAGTTTDEPDSTTTTGDGTSSSGGLPGTTGEPDFTCRDAIACINACAFELATNPSAEPDLGCLLDCVEDNLTVRETVNLLRLSNCVADVCEQEEACMPEMVDTGSSTGGSTGSSTGSSTGGSTTTGAEGDGDEGDDDDDDDNPIDPCLRCIFTKLSDDQPQVCQEFHAVCDAMDDE